MKNSNLMETSKEINKLNNILLLNNMYIRESGVMGDETLILLAQICISIVIGATILMTLLKLFVLNNQTRYTEEEFTNLVIKRTNAIDLKSNFPNANQDGKIKDLNMKLNCMLFTYLYYFYN